MKFSKIIIPLLLLLFTLTLRAQNIIISGYISDSLSREKLIGAHIWNEKSKIGTSSNAFGYFNLSLNKQSGISSVVKISYIGYATKTIKITGDTLLDIVLNKGKTLSEVNVTAQILNIEKRNEISTLSISSKDLEILPAIGGERDIFKAYQFMPGVQSGSEGNSSLYVRGGSPDQNLVLLDDVPLYNITHLGGFVGIFNSDAIKSSKLIKGGFPAQYGNRLSSVVDIRMKDGNNQKRESAFTIGLISTKLLLQGPLKKGKSSYMFSVRRFMYDLLLKPVSFLSSGQMFGYTFYDLNLKINHEINQKNHLFFSTYTGDDVFSSYINDKDTETKSKFKNRWGNSLMAIRWNHLYNTNVFSNTTLAYSRYRFGTNMIGESTSSQNDYRMEYNQHSSIQDFTLKQDLEYNIADFYNIKFGLTGIWHINRPAEFETYQESANQILADTSFINQQIGSAETAVYLENHFRFKNGLSGNLGFRFSDYFVSNTNFYSPEPRILLHYLIAGKYKLSSSFTIMKQYLHLLSGTSNGMKVAFWLPATLNVPPSQSYQYTFGFATTLHKQFELSIEGFYKEMTDLINIKEGIPFNSINTDWENKVETQGLGTVYGTEFLLQKRIGKHTGWLAYTWSKNMRQFHSINLGRAYPYRYDRRHDISIVYNLKINKKIDFSVTWVYGTGEAMTFPNAKFDAPFMSLDQINFASDHRSIYQSSGKNSVRGKAYHRLDIGMNFRKQKKKGIRTWNVSIFNVYNHANPYYYTSGTATSITNGNIKTNVRISGKSVFPIMPSVSYSYKF